MYSRITPQNTVFLILSFEGPDQYSQAGGLGVRVTDLGRSLAELGFESHLFFVGDPQKSPQETLVEGRLTLHRWCQWISAYHPGGVYQGEEGKVNDFRSSVPPALADGIIARALGEGKLVVVLGEEWHTTETLANLSDLLYLRGQRHRVLMYWNANNIFSFHRIDWKRLSQVATITTVSRYMKHYMWRLGLNPLVIPNGIHSRLLSALSRTRVKHLRSIWETELFLVKVGRYDPDKRWIMAVDAVAELKAMGRKPHLVMRGGVEPHRGDVLSRAAARDLSLAQVKIPNPTLDQCIKVLEDNREADLIELNFFLPEEFIRLLYASAHAVLANSGHEPFGLVGLEVMAAGGLAFTGNTGEDYAHSFENAVVVDTEEPREIAAYLVELGANPASVEQIRRNAQKTAAAFLWEVVIGELLRKLEFSALVKGVEIP